MPALMIFSYRSKLAGDDLSIVCILTATLRLVEFILLIPAATFTFQKYLAPSDECFGNKAGKTRAGVIPVPYLVISLFFAALTVLLSVAMYRISGRGSPTQPELRKKLGSLFAYQLFVMPFVLLMIAGVGISGVIYIRGRIECVGYTGNKPSWYSFLITVLTFQCFEVFVYMMIILGWLKFELRHRIMPKNKDVPKSIEEKTKEWDRCCKCCCKYTALCCCFSFGGRGIQNENFSSMACVLAELFDDGGTLDIVASDIIAAFQGLSMEQEEKKRKSVERLKEEAKKSQNEYNPDDVEMLDQATTSCAVVVTEPLKAILKMSLAMDVEAGTNASSLFRSKKSTEEGSNNTEDKRENAFIYKGSPIGDGERGLQIAIRELLSPNIGIDRFSIAEGAHFLRYSIALNSFKGFLFTNLMTNCCKLTFAKYYELPKYRKEATALEHSDDAPERVVIGENALGLHEAALMKVVGFDRSKVELHYAHFDNDVDQAVYAIMVDHVWKSVVLCIRGSLSLEDYVINLQVSAESLDATGAEYGFDGEGEYCHRGYLARAKWLCNDLKRHGILDILLDEDIGRYKDYTLRVSGHSLGAGTAAPVALMLRNKYPNLRCLCFGPPGGLFSKNLATRCEDFVTTFIVNADLVPRIAPRTVILLRDEVLQMIARIKVPKRQLFRIHRGAKKVNELPCGIKDLLYDADDIPDSEFKTQLDRFRAMQQAKDNEQIGVTKIPLHPPGKFVHLVKTKSKDETRMFLQGRFMMSDIFNCLTCDRFVPEEEYAPRYANISDFDEIVVSSTLVSDHMVEQVELALNFAATSFGIDPSEPPPSLRDGKGLSSLPVCSPVLVPGTSILAGTY